MIETILYGSFVGLSLGLTGGGGALFAIPLLVHGLGLDFRRAVAISLATIGLTALYGAILQARKGLVLWRAGAVLGIGGILSAPIGTVIGSYIPEKLSLILFTALMVYIGIQMLRRSSNNSSDVSLSWLRCERGSDATPRYNWNCRAKLFTGGAIIGLLAGIFGVGGGFLIVPALLLVAAISIERATATSLVATFLISTSGFASNFKYLNQADGELIIVFLFGAALGVTVGSYVKLYIPPFILRKGFAILVLGTAAIMLLRTW